MQKFHKDFGSKHLDETKRDFKFELIGIGEFEFRKSQLFIFEMH